MRADPRGVAEKLALGAALVSIAYGAFAVSRLHALGRRIDARTRPDERARTDARRSVTILKPVRGLEPELERNLRSFGVQTYPSYGVVFGVLDPNDGALGTLRRVAADSPQRTTVVAGDGVQRHRNPKIATLAAMIEHATGEVIVIADSDMRVTPEYLDAVVAPFADDRVGAVTCVYRGEPAADDLASALGAMGITEQFLPSTLVAAALEPPAYTFGSTMAVRREVLEAIGGIAALGDRLADDHTLGRLVTERGYRVAHADYVVANIIAEPGLRALALHELRWARTIRAVRPSGYPGIALTYPLPLALLYAMLARRRRAALPIVLLATAVRFALHRTAHGVARTERRPSPWLIPLRDTLGIAIWALGLRGRIVRWRDDTLHVDDTPRRHDCERDDRQHEQDQ
jgi:ceramide glucosyltransferase